MLSIVEKYQKAFELLGEEDSHLVVPGSLDWENARAFVKYLQIFYDTTLNMSGSIMSHLVYISCNFVLFKIF
jgi:hypothetical protein